MIYWTLLYVGVIFLDTDDLQLKESDIWWYCLDFFFPIRMLDFDVNISDTEIENMKV